MSEISSALQSARIAIEHPQCGGGFQTQVATNFRPFGDPQALAILLAVPSVPGATENEKKDAASLLELWERKCGHWRGDHLNRDSVAPTLPHALQHWQEFLNVALRS
ncbi:hypothetical protein PPN31114_00194 [Pandoraea pneumonica]|uniref:Uncharacterized protein n=1 Tax=Pandoraea pneumonica TaxID=2508299 RepID=A0A5E4RLX4_9BURK|nr:hypothetical protein [Pandoraea pneumonica]VVD62868.1 hypothetical protein PPN31114_00194 [Pandoraea pneumonica]